MHLKPLAKSKNRRDHFFIFTSVIMLQVSLFQLVGVCQLIERTKNPVARFIR